jgi:putative transposase
MYVARIPNRGSPPAILLRESYRDGGKVRNRTLANLARTLRSTKCIESMISVCREHAGNVKRWRDGQMALRWCAAGMVEAGKQFRRVNGHLHLPSLRAALEREVAKTVGPVVHND